MFGRLWRKITAKPKKDAETAQPIAIPSVNLKTRSDMVELVADSFQLSGFSANLLLVPSFDGGDLCVSLERKGGGRIVWGNADVNWAGSVMDNQGKVISSIKSKCPSDCQVVAEVVAAIKGPSIKAGAVPPSF